MAIDVKQYIDQLAQTAGLSQEEKDAILKVTANEKFAKGLGDDVLRQQDYSRNMDALKTEKAKWSDWYQKALTADQQRAQELADYQTQLAAYEAAYGKVDGTQRQVIQGVQTADLDKFRKELEEKDKVRDSQMISLLKGMGRIASQHAVEFKETLDTDALEKVAMERNLPLMQAYEEMVRPRREEKSTLARAEELKLAREEGARDALSKHHLPVDTGAKEYHPFFNPGDPKQQVEYTSKDGRLSPTAERQLRSNFVDEWNKTGQSTSGT